MGKRTEEDVFKAALEALKKSIAVANRFRVTAKEAARDARLRADRFITMQAGNRQVQYYVEIKKNVTTTNIGLFVQQKADLPKPLLLITEYVNGAMAERLREHTIEFIDTAGNAFMNQPHFYIFIKGNRPDELRQVPGGQAYRPTGLRVMFNFLCCPDLTNKTYREIAAAAGVAIGNIGWIITDLQAQGFLLDMGKRGRKLTNKETLLTRFVEEYPRKLRQQVLLGRFTGDQDWWCRENIDPQYAQWGGEIAAAKLTGYLKPQNVTVYMKPQYLDEFLLRNRLRKDIRGEVEILERFWQLTDTDRDNGLVHPFLIYADLMATADQRNIETARIIYDKHIIRHIGKD